MNEKFNFFSWIFGNQARIEPANSSSEETEYFDDSEYSPYYNDHPFLRKYVEKYRDRINKGKDTTAIMIAIEEYMLDHKLGE